MAVAVVLRPDPVYSTSNPQSPERALFMAVLLQALSDATSPTDSVYRQHARLFLEGDAVAMVAGLAGIPANLLPMLRDWQTWRPPGKPAPPNRPRRQRRPGPIMLEANGITLSIAEWSRQAGLNPETLYARLYRGWSPAQSYVVLDFQLVCQSVMGRVLRPWHTAGTLRNKPVSPSLKHPYFMPTSGINCRFSFLVVE